MGRSATEKKMYIIIVFCGTEFCVVSLPAIWWLTVNSNAGVWHD